MTAAAFPVPTGGVLVANANAHVHDHVVNKLQLGRGPIGIASGGAEALAKLDSGNWQTLILDRQLPDLDGEELRGIAEREYPGVRVMLLDPSPGSSPKSEALDTPTGNESKFARHCEPIPGMVGESGPMREMYRMVRLVAQRNTTVLVTGPTGSGKELAARAIHRLSGRASAGFAVLNCAAIPETTAVILRICYLSGRTETPTWHLTIRVDISAFHRWTKCHTWGRPAKRWPALQFPFPTANSLFAETNPASHPATRRAVLFRQFRLCRQTPGGCRRKRWHW